jgi:hypothetical protein
VCLHRVNRYGSVGSIETKSGSLRAKISLGWATSTTSHSSTSDPAEAEAVQCLELGTQKLEEGDVQAAKALYKRSVEIRCNASSLFNLGVTHYHLSASLTLYDPFFVSAYSAFHQRNLMRLLLPGKSP